MKPIPWLLNRVWALSVLALYGCSGFLSEPSQTPVEVVFDTPVDKIEDGVRLDTPEHDWDGFGEAVDVYGDVLVIGAPEFNHLGPGSAYVYRLSGAEWHEEAQLAARDRRVYENQDGLFEGQRFGSSVAIGDGIIAIGAPGNTIVGEYTGAVYLFEYDGQDWAETAKFAPGPLSENNRQTERDWFDYHRMRPRLFGALVALDGDTLAVGGDSTTDSVYVYQRGENGWQEQARIPVPGSPGRDLYMASMAIFGDTLALSTIYVPPQQEWSPFLTGSVTVYVFERDGEAWKESLRFIPEGGEGDLLFLSEPNVGASVALGGESAQAQLLAVGLPGFPDWSGVEEHLGLFGASPEEKPEFPQSNRATGAVYIFERGEQGGWDHRVTLKPAGFENPPGPGHLFTGFPFPTDDGQVDFDEVAYYASVVFPGHLYSEDPEISFFGATADLDGNRLAVTAGFANATYIFERQGEDWSYRFSISPSREDVKGWEDFEDVMIWEDFAQVAAISGDTLLLGTPGEFGDSAYVFSLAPEAGGD